MDTTHAVTPEILIRTDDPPDPGRPRPWPAALSRPCPVPVRLLRAADSPRRDGEDPRHTEMLTRIDARLPPIIVHRPTMRVIDGTHRLGAAIRRGDEFIEVRFFDGTEQEAFVLAVRSNISHGLPLSLADRTRAAERIVADHPAWSDRSIAAAVGLGARTISNIRRRLRLRSGVEEHARTGRDGRVRPLDGTVGRLKAWEIIQDRPGASLREVAREAGVSPSTVQDVRRRVESGEDPVPPQVARQRPATGPTVPAGSLPRPDPAAVLHGLQNDPSLRFSESGRDLLRWMYQRVIRTGERTDVLGSVPPQSAGAVAEIADLARACADEWLRLADHVEHSGSR